MSNVNLLVTFFLFAYNQEKYIEEACRAAFSQTYTPLEIIISDDCSTDKTFEIISRLAQEYRGPHSLVINRNDENLGLVGHVNKAFAMSKGEIIVAAAGDDISFPNRTAILVEAFDNSMKPLLVYSNVTGVDKNGHSLSRPIPFINSQNVAITELCQRVGIYRGASGAWSKELYELFGPITENNAFEDGVFGFRAALLARAYCVDESLLLYRVNVGISTFASDRGFVCAFLAERRKQRMLIGLMWQRKKDLIRMAGRLEASSCDALNKILDGEIEALSIRYHFYSNPMVVLKSILKFRFSSLKAAVGMEVDWLKSYFSRNNF